ncbi:hypothetical protein [Nocardioides sp. NPDC047086]|uniref:hypothetical protein n=1 Tax=Nocardioides sp. NPDC047086 TaxID=3154810 RepID=UPI0033C2795A
MPPHARFATLLAALVMVLGLAASTPAPDSPAPAGTVAVAAPSSSVARPIPHETFTLSGSLGPSVPRVVRPQTYDEGEWRVVQKQSVARSGDYSFEVTQPSSVRTRWRVLAYGIKREGRGWRERVTAPRTLFGQPQTVTTSVARSVRAGSALRLTLFAAPARPGRVLALQRDSGQGWQKVTDLTTDATGHATYAFRTRGVAKTRFRAVARAHHGAPAVAGTAAAVYAIGDRPVGVMAWRGDSLNYPENTLDAFRSAVHRQGAKVGTWPAVGTASVLRAAVSGVDFVTTDDVAGARSALLR